jgi:hypothetical protein
MCFNKNKVFLIVSISYLEIGREIKFKLENISGKETIQRLENVFKNVLMSRLPWLWN